jgi:hypothetical protein
LNAIGLYCGEFIVSVVSYKEQSGWLAVERGVHKWLCLWARTPRLLFLYRDWGYFPLNNGMTKKGVKYIYPQTCIYLGGNLKKQLQEYAKEHKLSVSTVIRRLVIDLVDGEEEYQHYSPDGKSNKDYLINKQIWKVLKGIN